MVKIIKTKRKEFPEKLKNKQSSNLVVVKVSWRWLQNYVNNKFARVPRGKLIIEYDELWKSILGVYQQCAIAYTDFWESYKTVIPASRHRPVLKSSGETNYIEWLNNTLRQRISRLVRKSLYFSKELDNHIGAIWYFIHHYNDVIANS